MKSTKNCNSCSKKLLIAISLLTFLALPLIAQDLNQDPKKDHKTLQAAFDQKNQTPQSLTPVHQTLEFPVGQVVNLSDDGTVDRNVAKRIGRQNSNQVRNKYGVPNAVWAGVGGTMAASSAIALGVTATTLPWWGITLLSGGIAAGLVLAIIFGIRAYQVYDVANSIDDFFGINT